MADKHADPKTSFSGNINRYHSETRVNVTEYEYTWIIRDFAKCLDRVISKKPLSFNTNKARPIKSPMYVTLLENIEYTWSMKLHLSYDGPASRLDQIFHPQKKDIAIEITPTYCQQSCEEFYLMINLLDSNGKLVDLNCEGYYTFQESQFFAFTGEDLAAVDGNLTFVIKIFHENEDDIHDPVRIESLDTILDERHRLLDLNDFECLLENGKFSDVTLIVGNEKFRVHKNILSARSPVFSVMLENHMRENDGNELTITNIEPQAMKDLLRFIYAGKIQDIDKLDAGLFLAANKYGLTRLRDACEIALIQNLNMDNLEEILRIVDLYAPDKLLDKVIRFMKMNSKIITSNKKLSKILNEMSSSLLMKVIDTLHVA